MRYFFCTIHKTPKRFEVTDEFALGILKDHTSYLQDLGKAGRCLVAGPFVDQTSDYGSSCYILISEDDVEARKLADEDPLVREGLSTYRMLEWKKVV